MKKINLAITGCMGRMGQQIIKSARLDKNFKIVTITENKIINKKIYGLRPCLNTEEAIKKANLIKCLMLIMKMELQSSRQVDKTHMLLQ